MTTRKLSENVSLLDEANTPNLPELSQDQESLIAFLKGKLSILDLQVYSSKQPPPDFPPDMQISDIYGDKHFLDQDAQLIVWKKGNQVQSLQYQTSSPKEHFLIENQGIIIKPLQSVTFSFKSFDYQKPSIALQGLTQLSNPLFLPSLGIFLNIEGPFINQWNIKTDGAKSTYYRHPEGRNILAIRFNQLDKLAILSDDYRLQIVPLQNPQNGGEVLKNIRPNFDFNSRWLAVQYYSNDDSSTPVTLRTQSTVVLNLEDKNQSKIIPVANAQSTLALYKGAHDTFLMYTHGSVLYLHELTSGNCQKHEFDKKFLQAIIGGQPSQSQTSTLKNAKVILQDTFRYAIAVNLYQAIVVFEPEMAASNYVPAVLTNFPSILSGQELYNFMINPASYQGGGVQNRRAPHSAILDDEEQFNAVAKAVFQRFDTDGSGFIERSELSNAMSLMSSRGQASAQSDDRIDKVMKALDKNDDGKVDFNEFKVLVRTMLKAQVNRLDQAGDHNRVAKFKAILDNEEQFNAVAKVVFQRYDVDGSGFIERSELGNAMNQVTSQAQASALSDDRIDKVMRVLDKNDDGKIDFNEFKVLARTMLNARANRQDQGGVQAQPGLPATPCHFILCDVLKPKKKETGQAELDETQIKDPLKQDIIVWRGSKFERYSQDNFKTPIQVSTNSYENVILMQATIGDEFYAITDKEFLKFSYEDLNKVKKKVLNIQGKIQYVDIDYEDDVPLILTTEGNILRSYKLGGKTKLNLEYNLQAPVVAVAAGQVEFYFATEDKILFKSTLDDLDKKWNPYLKDKEAIFPVVPCYLNFQIIGEGEYEYLIIGFEDGSVQIRSIDSSEDPPINFQNIYTPGYPIQYLENLIVAGKPGGITFFDIEQSEMLVTLSTYDIWNESEAKELRESPGFNALKVEITKNQQTIVVSTRNTVQAFRNPLEKNQALWLYGPDPQYLLFLHHISKLFKNKEKDTPKYFPEFNEFYFTNNSNILSFYVPNNYIAIVQEAIDNNIAILTSITGQSPLTFAATYQYREMTKMLFSKMDSDPRKQDHLYDYVMRQNCFTIAGYTFVQQVFKKIYKEAEEADEKYISMIASEYASSLPIITNWTDFEKNIYNSLRVHDSNSVNVPVKLSVSKIPFPTISGSRESLEFLDGLIQCENPLIHETEFIQDIIHYKWKTAFKYMLIQTILYSLYLISFCAHLALDDFEYIGLGFMISFIFVLLLVFEGVPIMAQVNSYKADPWNLVDLLLMLLSIVYGACYIIFQEGEALQYLLVITILCSFYRGLSYFRTFQTTMYLIEMIWNVLYDMLPFLFLLFYTTFAVCFIYISLSFSDTKDSFESEWQASFLLNIGDYGTDEYNRVQWFVFVVAIIFNQIVMLNLLIAIISDTFDRVQNQRVFEDSMSMLRMIRECESFMNWNRDLGKEDFLVSVKAERYGEDDTEWEGKIRKIHKKILKVGTIIDDIKGTVQERNESMVNLNNEIRRLVIATKMLEDDRIN